MNKEQYVKFPESAQQQISHCLFGLLKQLPHTKIASDIRITLKELPLKTEHICNLLSRFVEDVISHKDKEGIKYVVVIVNVFIPG